MTEKMLEQIDSVDAGRYSLKFADVLAIIGRGNGDKFTFICDAFKFGFLKGQRAEKAARKSREGKR